MYSFVFPTCVSFLSLGVFVYYFQPPTVSSAAVDRELYLNQRLRACDLESWYPQLQQFTFPALFIPLSPIEATAIVAQYWQLKARHSVSHDSSLALEQLQARIHVAGLQLARIGAVASLGQSLGQPQDQAQGVGDSGGGAAPTASREPSVSINTLPVGGSEVVHRDCSPATSFPSVFVKLSCRSPKDSLGRQER